MPTLMQLGEFSDRLLEAQGLDGFTLAFVPHRGKGGRRSKRSTVTVEVLKLPEDQGQMQSGRTVSDLYKRFHALAPETAQWTEPGQQCYRLRLRDHNARLVEETETLGDLRARQGDERKKFLEKAHRTLAATFKELERGLEDKEILSLVTAALKERYSH